MAVNLKGYDGVVENIEILHGVAVADRPLTSASHPPKESTGDTGSAHPHADSEQMEVAHVVERVFDVIGTREAATRWLGTPVGALGYATPVSKLSSKDGREEVLAVLWRLEYGVL